MSAEEFMVKNCDDIYAASGGTTHCFVYRCVSSQSRGVELHRASEIYLSHINFPTIAATASRRYRGTRPCGASSRTARSGGSLCRSPAACRLPESTRAAPMRRKTFSTILNRRHMVIVALASSVASSELAPMLRVLRVAQRRGALLGHALLANASTLWRCALHSDASAGWQYPPRADASAARQRGPSHPISPARDPPPLPQTASSTTATPRSPPFSSATTFSRRPSPRPSAAMCVFARRLELSDLFCARRLGPPCVPRP